MLYVHLHVLDGSFTLKSDIFLSVYFIALLAEHVALLQADLQVQPSCQTAV